MKDFILDLDRPRKLRFGFKALEIIAGKFGKDAGLEELMAIQMHEMPGLVWPGLIWEDKKLTYEQAVDLLDASIPEKHTIIGITAIALEALAAHMGVEIDVKKAVASALKEAKKEMEEEAGTAVEETKEKKKGPKKTFPSQRSTKQRKKPH